MPKQIVNISDTIKQFQEKFNTLSTDLGWRGKLMTTEDSDVVGAINEVDYRLDSINSNQINSPHLFIRDSSETSNIIKGGLKVHGQIYGRQAVDLDATLNVEGDVTLNNNVDIDGTLNVDGSAQFQDDVSVAKNLHVTGNTTMGGTLVVDGEVTFKAGANSNINLGDGDGDNVVFNADVNSNIIPNTDDAYDLGSATKEWKDLFIDGTAHIDTLDVDENATVAGTLGVTGATTLSSTLDVSDSSSFGDNVSIDGNVNIGGTVTSQDTAFKIKSDAATTSDVNLSDTITVAGGEGIDTTISGKTITVKGEDASTTNKGIAKFNADDFSTSDGNVSIKTSGVSNTQIANSYWTVADSAGDTYPIDLGDQLQLMGTGGKISVAKGVEDTITFSLDTDVMVDNNLHVTNDATVAGNLLVTGDFVVSGATRTISHVLKMGEGIDGGTTPTLDGIISFDRGNADSAQLKWNETHNWWEAGTTNDMAHLVREGDSASLSNLTLSGNLTVSGTTTTVNTETINLADNIILLNSNATGAPTENSGIEVERGSSTNVDLRFDETSNRWSFTNDGSTYYNIPISTEYNHNNYTLPLATNTLRGGIELFSNTDQSVAANTVSTTAGRTYGIQLNSANQAVVNVPWVDTNTNTTYSAGSGISLSGTQFSVAGGTALTQDTNGLSVTANGIGATQLNVTGNGTTTQYLRSDGDGSFSWVTPPNTTYSTATSSTLGLVKIGYSENGKNYPVELSSGKMFVNVPWVDTNTNTDTIDMGDGFKIANSGGTDQFTVTENEEIRFAGSGATSVSFDAATQKVTISSTDTNTNTNKLTTFQVEDGDGNEVTISDSKEWKFVEGDENVNASGNNYININWTDTSPGSNADPYDLSFSHKRTTRTDTTSTTNQYLGSSFTCISAVTTNATGHVTAANVETVNMPPVHNVTLKIKNSAGTVLKTIWGGSTNGSGA